MIIRLIIIEIDDVDHDRAADRWCAGAGSPGAPALIGRREVANPILADRDPSSEISDRGSREIPIASVIRVIRVNLYREPELYPKRCEFGIVRCNLRGQPYRLPIACRSTPLIVGSAAMAVPGRQSPYPDVRYSIHRPDSMMAGRRRSVIPRRI